MKRLFLLLTLFVVLGVSCSGDGDKVVNKPKPNEIWYTTTDGKKLFPNNTEPAAFGTLLASNIYKDGQGVLTFDDDITERPNLSYNHLSVTLTTSVKRILW